MNTVISIILALGVTLSAANPAPRTPIKPLKLLPKAKESTLASEVQTKLVVNLRQSAREEEIKLLNEPLENHIFNRTKRSSIGNFQTNVPDLLRELINVNLAKTSLPLSNKGIREPHGSTSAKTFIDGRKNNHLSKSIDDGISGAFTQTHPPDLLNSRSRKSNSENADELDVLLQQDSVLNSPQHFEKTNGGIPNIEQILVSDTAYQIPKVPGNEFKFTSVPKSPIILKQESIFAPPLDYLIEPGDKSVVVQQYDFNQGEVRLSNILAQQAIDALNQESADILKLDSVSSLALESLLPPLDDLKTYHDGLKSSSDVLDKYDATPVKTILNLWESDEYIENGSDFNEYYEETKTGDEEGSGNNYGETKF